MPTLAQSCHSNCPNVFVSTGLVAETGGGSEIGGFPLAPPKRPRGQKGNLQKGRATVGVFGITSGRSLDVRGNQIAVVGRVLDGFLLVSPYQGYCLRFAKLAVGKRGVTHLMWV